MPDDTTTPITSAEELPTQLAPSDYRPTLSTADMIYDDEAEQTPQDGAWHQYFAGGSNRPHWVMADATGQIHFVETAGWGGNYEVYSPDYYLHFTNGYDAFWHAEQAAHANEQTLETT